MANNENKDPERPAVQRGELGNRRAPGKPRPRQKLPSRDLARSADVYYTSGTPSAIRNDGLDRSTSPGDESAAPVRRASPLQDRNTDKYYREQPRPRAVPDLPQRPRSQAASADKPKTNPLRAIRNRPDTVSAGRRARVTTQEDDMADNKQRRVLDQEPVPMTVPRLQPGKFKMLDVGDSKDDVKAAIPRIVEIIKSGHQVRITVPRKRVILLRTLLDYQRTHEEITAEEYARAFVVVAADVDTVTTAPVAESVPEVPTEAPVATAKSTKKPGKKATSKKPAGTKGADPLRQQAEPVTIDDLVASNAADDEYERKQSASGAAVPTEIVDVGDDEFLMQAAD